MQALANDWCAGAVLEQSISRVGPWRLNHKPIISFIPQGLRVAKVPRTNVRRAQTQ